MNAGLRHGGTKDSKYTYFKPLLSESLSGFVAADNIGRYLASKYYEEVQDQGAFYAEHYAYNKAFDNIGSIKRYYPISVDYDFCSECLEEFPYRIYYSELDDIERRKDAYRQIRPNNYVDLDGANGPITDLFVNFNELYAATPHSLYNLPTNQQVLSTEDAESVYIGSGKVFQMSPRPMKSADNAFGGIELWKSRVLTEYGAFYMDTSSGRPVLLTNSLKDLSLEGMRTYFQKNAPLKFLDQFKLLTGQTYTNTSTVSDEGVGYISTYDPRFKRLIVHKKDYTFNPSAASMFILYTPEQVAAEEFTPPSRLWSDGNKFYYGEDRVYLGDPTYFQDRSFTISYSFLSQSWVSYHSYFPYYMFFDNNTFYSNDIYTHGVGPYQEYYGTKYDHFVDIILPLDLNEQKTFSSFNYVSDTWLYNSSYEAFTKSDKTYDKAIFYNSDQSSGFTYIVSNPAPFTTVTAPSILAKRTDNKWKINDPRDNTISNVVPV